VFLAIAGLGSYYASTRIGDISLPSTSTANPITIPIPTPATSQTYTLATKVDPEGAGQVSPSTENETYTPGTEVTLTADPDSVWDFREWRGDIPNSSRTDRVIRVIMDSNKNVTAHFQRKDTTPPVITDVELSSYTDTNAAITWITSENATSQVEYWKTDGDHNTSPLDDDLVQSHTVRVTGLKPNTTYHFSAKSADASGNEATSNTKTLLTLRTIPEGHEVGNRAPDFEPLPLFDADSPSLVKHDKPKCLSDFPGKTVVLNFWSTHCGACVVEFPFIRDVYHGDTCRQNDNSASLAVISICVDGDRTDRIEKIIERHTDLMDFDFPILLDLEGTTIDTYHIWTVPMTVFIDSDRIIKEIKIGRFRDTEEIEDILKGIQ